MDKPERFEGARLKVKRADRHIQEFAEVLAAFLKTDFCKLRIEEDGKSGSYSLKVDATAPFPPQIPLIIGDAVHNLRSALDHIVTVVTGDDSDWMSLPTGRERKDVIATSKYGTIKKTLPDFAHFIVEEIQPYAGGKFKIWELGKLNNIDKHKLLIPTINVSSLMGVSLEDERGNSVSNCHFAVEQGAVAGMVAGLGRITKIHDQGKPGVNVSFGPTTPLQDQPALETLAQISELTLQAVNAFELFWFGQHQKRQGLK